MAAKFGLVLSNRGVMFGATSLEVLLAGGRLREAGLVSLDEIAEAFGVNKWVIESRRLTGQLPIRSHRLDDQGQHMYERPAPDTSLQCRRSPARADEVQIA